MSACARGTRRTTVPSATRCGWARRCTWRGGSASTRRPRSRPPGGGSHDRARFVEAEPGAARGQPARVAVAEVAQEVRLDVALGEELLVAAFAVLPRREELLVQLRVVEPGHRAAVQAQGAGGHDHVGAYMIMAARALGLDCGPMSGFDNAKLDEEFFAAGKNCEGCNEEFFPEGHVKSNFLCNLGYGDPSRLPPRSPRLGFDEACSVM